MLSTMPCCNYLTILMFVKVRADVGCLMTCESLSDRAGLSHLRSGLYAQVVLLDPVQYPGAMKAFAREVCRNDLLNFGRLHFFFPDSRMSLDLNTDKTLKVNLTQLLHGGSLHSILRTGYKRLMA